MLSRNPEIGFSSIHYIVTESCGNCIVSVHRKKEFLGEIYFGIRTSEEGIDSTDATAKPGSNKEEHNYEPINK